ncbi:MAG: hypothetical protein HZC25_04410 [Rhodospirillales bacterium]|nr:hypothetical protein [Rhodospirillales bacterium]
MNFRSRMALAILGPLLGALALAACTDGVLFGFDDPERTSRQQRVAKYLLRQHPDHVIAERIVRSSSRSKHGMGEKNYFVKRKEPVLLHFDINSSEYSSLIETGTIKDINHIFSILSIDTGLSMAIDQSGIEHASIIYGHKPVYQKRGEVWTAPHG